MLLLKIAWKEEGKTIKKNQNYYYLKPSEDLTFFPGRRADIYVNDKKIGIMGIIHPEVLSNFRIPLPCSALEICIESFI
jgi:phenylalanyl-tRNA synthetase beta chain